MTVVVEDGPRVGDRSAMLSASGPPRQGAGATPPSLVLPIASTMGHLLGSVVRPCLRGRGVKVGSTPWPARARPVGAPTRRPESRRPLPPRIAGRRLSAQRAGSGNEIGTGPTFPLNLITGDPHLLHPATEVGPVPRPGRSRHRHDRKPSRSGRSPSKRRPRTSSASSWRSGAKSSPSPGASWSATSSTLTNISTPMSWSQTSAPPVAR